MVGDHMGIPRTVVLFCFYASSGCTLLPQGDSTDVSPRGADEILRIQPEPTDSRDRNSDTRGYGRGSSSKLVAAASMRMWFEDVANKPNTYTCTMPTRTGAPPLSFGGSREITSEDNNPNNPRFVPSPAMLDDRQ
jgi:hypothetical protein